MPSNQYAAEMLARSPVVIMDEDIVPPQMLTHTQVELYFPYDVEIDAQDRVLIDTGVFFKIPEGKVLRVTQVPNQQFPRYLFPQHPVSIKIEVDNPTKGEVSFLKGQFLCQLELTDDPNLKLDLSQEVPPNGFQY